MNDAPHYSSDQEAFWAGDFGEQYISRNQGNALLASNLAFFSKALKQATGLESCIEFGANIGMNLKALRLLYPELGCAGIEINAEAAAQLSALIGAPNVTHGSILDYQPDTPRDLALIKGVLIHLNPVL